jgi:hypothetical protein
MVRVFCSSEEISLPDIGVQLKRHDVVFMPFDDLMSSVEARSAISDGRILITVLEKYDMTKKKTSPQMVPPYVRKLSIPLTPHPSELEQAEKEKEDKVLKRIDERMNSMEEKVLSSLEGMISKSGGGSGIDLKDLETIADFLAQKAPSGTSSRNVSAQTSVHDDVDVYIPDDLTSNLGDQEVNVASSHSEESGHASAASKLRALKKNKKSE